MTPQDKTRLEGIRLAIATGFYTDLNAEKAIQDLLDLIDRQEEEIMELTSVERRTNTGWEKVIEQNAEIVRLCAQIKELTSELERLEGVVGYIDFNLIEQVLQKVKGKV